MDTNSKTNEDTLPLSPEEIKAIGEIAIGPSRHEQFLNAHYRKLMWGGITLGIVAGGDFQLHRLTAGDALCRDIAGACGNIQRFCGNIL